MKLKMTNARNSALRVNLRLWIPKQNSYVRTASIFDTGASKTIIDAGLVELLGITPKSAGDVATITTTGKISLQTCVLPKIMLGTREIRDVPVSIIKLPTELEVRCVLGMNVLREFMISIDSLSRSINLEIQPFSKEYFKENYSISLLSDSCESAEIR